MKTSKNKLSQLELEQPGEPSAPEKAEVQQFTRQALWTESLISVPR